MNEIIEISALKRENSLNLKKARNDGKVPAIIYGENKDPILITVDTKIIKKQIQQTGFFSRQFELKIGNDSHRVLPKDLQLHPVKETIVHLDFLRVGQNTKVTVSVPVRFINENSCEGLKQGGVINIVRHDIDVRSPVNKIPEAFEVDLDGLQIGDSIHVSSIKIDEEVKLMVTDRDFTIATIAPPTVIAVEEEKVEGGTEADEKDAESEESQTEDKKEEPDKKE
ncbi:50S ribosomal protein L25/general stress protein Ctc [Rickettsiales bacterium]|nr:50S ribosomal protein L25/general stress protein Ctc [Rickettsiales bacterium]